MTCWLFEARIDCFLFGFSKLLTPKQKMVNKIGQQFLSLTCVEYDMKETLIGKVWGYNVLNLLNRPTLVKLFKNEIEVFYGNVRFEEEKNGEVNAIIDLADSESSHQNRLLYDALALKSIPFSIRFFYKGKGVHIFQASVRGLLIWIPMVVLSKLCPEITMTYFILQINLIQFYKVKYVIIISGHNFLL